MSKDRSRKSSLLIIHAFVDVMKSMRCFSLPYTVRLLAGIIVFVSHISVILSAHWLFVVLCPSDLFWLQTAFASTESDHRVFVPEAWPKDTGAPINSSPALGDLDGDGVLEIVVGSDNNKVYAWKPDGTLMPGWPVNTGDSVRSSPALADIDGDGRLDVIVGSFDNKVYAWNFNGSLLPGWPAVTGSVVYSSPAVGDIDGDQQPEVVVGSFDNKVYAWNADGTLVRGWPKPTGLFVYSSPALADIDRDGLPEVIVGTDNNRVFAWNGDGTDVAGSWPAATEHVVPSSPAVGDLDKDTNLEIVAASWDKVFVWNRHGERKPGWPFTAGHQIPSSPALADLNNDGWLEIIVGCKDGKVYALDADGRAVPGWPTVTDAEISSSPAVADLNGDGWLEVVIGSKDSKVYIWGADGRLFPGWPKNTGGAISSSPAIGDLDLDGTLEVVIGSKDNNVYAWSFAHTGTSVPKIVWQNFHGDLAHTGQYGIVEKSYVIATRQPPIVKPGPTPQMPRIQPEVRSPIAQPSVEQSPTTPRQIIDGYISDLMISGYDNTQVRLTWTAPPGTRTAHSVYDIRYSTQPITEETWQTTTQYPQSIPLAPAGTREVWTLTNLPLSDTLYFAVRVTDGTQIGKPISNVARLERLDTTAPAKIQGLKVRELNDITLELSWQTTGDDGITGTAATYDLRYAEVPLTELTWSRAFQIENEPAPLPAGAEQKFQIQKPWQDREVFFGIKAIDESLNISELSEIAVLSPRDDIPPSRIVDLRVKRISGTDVTIAWTAPGNNLNMGKAQRYDVRYSDFLITESEWASAIPIDNPPLPENAGTIQEYTLRGVPIGAKRFIGIKAIDGTGNHSELSNVIATAMDDLIPPATINDLTIDQIDKDWVNVSWTASGDDDKTGVASAYILRYGGNLRVVKSWNGAMDVPDLPIPSVVGARDSATIRGLSENTTYYLGLRVLDEQGNSSETSNIVRVKTFGRSTPETITDLVIEELRTDGVTLNWTAPQDFGEQTPNVSGYEIRSALAEITENTWETAKKLASVSKASDPGTLETFTIRGTPQDAAYYVAIKSYDALGNMSGLSNVVQVPKLDLVPPDPVIDLFVEDAGTDWARISWTATGDDGKAGQASSYLIRVASTLNQLRQWDQATEIPTPLQPSPSGVKDSFTITRLESDSTFFVGIKSVDAFGNISELSNIVRAKTKDAFPPAAIRDLQYAGEEKKSILLTWTAPGENGTEGQATAYDIRYAQEPITQETWTSAQLVPLVPRPKRAGSVERVTVTELEPNTKYWFAVVAIDASENVSPLSNVVEVLTKDTVAPPAITTLRVEQVGKGTVSLTWVSPGDDELHDRPARYEIRYSQQLLNEASWSKATLFEESPAPSEKGEQERMFFSELQALPYHIGVKAIDEAGNVSELSNIIQVYPSEDRIVDLEVFDFSDQTVILTWTAPGGELSHQDWVYDIRYATTPITEGNWAKTSPAKHLIRQELRVQEPGRPEKFELRGLEPNTRYWFAVVTIDASENVSPLSNVIVVLTKDTVAPPAITTLRAEQVGKGTVSLTWVSPGDDVLHAQPARYEIRYLGHTARQKLLDEASWSQATQAEESPEPSVKGEQERFVLSGLQPLFYNIGVKAIDAAGNASEISNIIQVYPSEEKVVDLEILDFSGEMVTLTWTAPGGDLAAGEQLYDIRYAKNPISEENWVKAISAKNLIQQDLTAKEPGQTEKFELTSLPPDEQLFFAVKVMQPVPRLEGVEKRLSALSNVVELNRIDIIPPGNVNDLQVHDLGERGGLRVLELSWKAPGDNNFDGIATKYDLRYGTLSPTEENWATLTSVADVPAPEAPGTPQQTSVRFVPGEETLYFALKTFDEALNVSALSNVAQWAPEDTIPPAPIMDLAAKRLANGDILVSWTAPGDNENRGVAAIYDIRYATEESELKKWDRAIVVPGEPLPQVAGTQQEYTIPGLRQNITYYIAMQTIDDVKNVSKLSNIVVIPEVPLARINDLTIVGSSDTTITISWTSLAKRMPEERIIKYEIRLSEDWEQLKEWKRANKVKQTLVPQPPGSPESLTIRELSPNKQYYIAVRAITDTGDISELSNIILASTSDTIPPKPITDLTVQATTQNSVTLTWTVQTDDLLHEIPARYELRYSPQAFDEMGWDLATAIKPADVMSLQPTALGTQMAYTVSGLGEKVTYCFAVRAIDASGNLSPLSNMAMARTNDVTPPQAITDLKASFPTANSVTLSWISPPDAPGGVPVAESGLTDEGLLNSGYDIRYMPLREDSLLNEQSWERAEKVLIPPKALPPGSAEEFVVRNLDPATTYYFAIKTIDQSGNIAAISNTAVLTTLLVEPVPPAVSTTLSTADAQTWGVFRGDEFGTITKDASGVFVVQKKPGYRGIDQVSPVLVGYPRGYNKMSVPQGELSLRLKSKDQFILYAEVTSVLGETYYLCYAPAQTERMLPSAPDISSAEVSSPEPDIPFMPDSGSRKRVENYVFYQFDKAIQDGKWHDVHINFAEDLFRGTGQVYTGTTRIFFQGQDFAFKDMVMHGVVLTTIADFDDRLDPSQNGWKIHFGEGTVQVISEPVVSAIEGVAQSNAFLLATSANSRELVLTYPQDSMGQLSDRPIFQAEVNSRWADKQWFETQGTDDFKLILKVSTKDNREYYLAYIPEEDVPLSRGVTGRGLSGNYIYLPLYAEVTPKQSDRGNWILVRVNIAEDLQKYQLDYAYTSWVSFHGREFGLDNVQFSTGILRTPIE